MSFSGRDGSLSKKVYLTELNTAANFLKLEFWHKRMHEAEIWHLCAQ